MKRSCTLFIYLLQDAGGHQWYFASVVTDSSGGRALAPTAHTHEVTALRRHILKKLESYPPASADVQEFKREIGEAITDLLGFNEFFDRVCGTLHDDTDVTLFTNDSLIPFEWAYFPSTDKFLCTAYHIGKLLPEKPLPVRSTTPRYAVKRPREHLQKLHAIILFDDYKNAKNNCGLVELSGVQNEIQAISEMVKACGMPEKNIHLIYGGQKNAEPLFMEALRAYHRSLLLVHFSGHVTKAGLALSDQDSVIEGKEISNALAKKHLDGTMVFLNGCRSGCMQDVWATQENISTSFLAVGASGCICTLGPIRDSYASKFASQFYSLVLRDEINLSIAEALRRTRLECNAGIRLESLLWTLYGFPDRILLDQEVPL